MSRWGRVMKRWELSYVTLGVRYEALGTELCHVGGAL